MTLMPMKPCSRPVNQDWVRTTSLFRQWSEIKEEILRHKWYESEKAGYDIGWERASVDWMIRFGSRHSRSS